MNAVTRIANKSPFAAPSIDRRSSDDLALVRNSAIRDYPAAPEILLAPMPRAIRSRLEERKLELERCLAPCPKAEHPRVAKLIAGMLGAFGGNSGGSPEAVVAKYIHVLADLPAWSIAAACEALERGEVEGASLDFRPSAARVRDSARALLAPWLEEFAQIRRALEMPALELEDAAMRQRIGGLLAKLANDLRTGKRP